MGRRNRAGERESGQDEADVCACEADGPISLFASAARATSSELERTIQRVTQSPITTALLRSATSMMCVLNEHRQVVTLNTAYLDSLDVAHSDDVIGLRPGEAMHCTHAEDNAAGCGTGAHCRHCDLVHAIVTSQQSGRTVERECIVSVRDRKGALRDISLAVRSVPLELDGEPFMVLCMTDVSQQKLHAGLERSFLHDLSNLVMALLAYSESLRTAPLAKSLPLVDDISDLTRRLSREVVVQRLLLSRDPSKHRINWQPVKIPEMLGFLQRLFSNHPVAVTKRLVVDRSPVIEECVTDPSLLERVLTNMLMNAFEATSAGCAVKLSVAPSDDGLKFAVWNGECMSPTVSRRVFRRHFSTKKGEGRGQGTYAIKLLGETLLRGNVGFDSSPENGTTFFLDVPRNGQAASSCERLRHA
jgi:K+-sensing histidine kinase KdpD